MEQIFNRIIRLDALIKIKGTGSPKELANRIGVSERSIYKYIQLMKDYGAPIKFSSGKRSYYYEETGQFYISFRGQ